MGINKNFEFWDVFADEIFGPAGDHNSTPESTPMYLMRIMKANPESMPHVYRLEEITNIKSKMNEEMRRVSHYLHYRTTKSTKYIDYKLEDEKVIQNSSKPKTNKSKTSFNK